MEFRECPFKQNCDNFPAKCQLKSQVDNLIKRGLDPSGEEGAAIKNNKGYPACPGYNEQIKRVDALEDLGNLSLEPPVAAPSDPQRNGQLIF